MDFCHNRTGDQIYLSQSEHEGNVSPWLQMAEERGCTVNWLPLCPETCTLDLDALESMLAAGSPDGDRNRLLAIGAAANATGTMHDVPRAIRLAKAAGCDYTIVDAVQYAPHKLIDVQAWGCDFAFTSSYKWFGPHITLMYPFSRWMLMSLRTSCTNMQTAMTEILPYGSSVHHAWTDT
eukprot:COSAG01_NODE_11678_length_1882_cov_1.293326_3_plen_179_part_00